ncbi:MAG: hypothetical protein P1P69_02250 [Methanosarcinaceae archaeon]|nr:hypothetical protein [Methanosarcinaceae archaeon]MDF1533309.1 hypothetical protein [Methanosarcinaceae archaeon]
MAILSKRMGAVMRIKPYFIIYYFSIVFILIAAAYSSFVPYSEKGEMIGNLIFAIGMTLGLVATIKYWGWLVKELM